MVLEPLASKPLGVFRIIVLLKHHLSHFEVVMRQCLEPFFLEDACVEPGIHSSLDETAKPDSFGNHAAPKHQATSTILAGLPHVPLC